MPIDIDKLTEAELIDLDNRVVERLKFLCQMRAHARMHSIAKQGSETMIIDAWSQHPTLRHISDPMFDSLRRCVKELGFKAIRVLPWLWELPPTEFMGGHGRHKVLFGTNDPMIMPAKALDGVDALGLDEESKQLFLAGNASRVFALG